MNPSSGFPRSGAPAALSAFLRGVERRGAVLAELQAGDADAGDAALVAAMTGFRAEAETLPMTEWPHRFWARLLAEPGLRSRTPVAVPIEATDRLGELGAGPRAALLLRLAAGLSEEDAASVLAVAPESYRLALQRALPRQPDGRADPQAWRLLREQIHRRIKTLPPARLLRLSAAREAVLRGDAPPLAAGTPGRAGGATRRPPPRWLPALLWSLLALCVLALAATFWWPTHWTLERTWGGQRGGPKSSGVRVQPLPEAEAPAARYDAELALIAHRDFDLLADPAGEAEAAELAFHSWLSAQQAAGAVAPPPADAETEAGIEVPAAPTTEETDTTETGVETEAETAHAP